MGKRLGTQWESLLSKATDSAGLARSLVKWWAKKSPVEQSEAEVDFLEWVSSIRGTWGECDAAKEKLEVLEKINKAMEKRVGMVRGEGKELDWSELVLEATMELTSHDDSDFNTIMDGLLVDLPQPKGSSEQEDAVRTLIAHAVSKITKQGRRAELAAALEAAVGEVTEGKK